MSVQTFVLLWRPDYLRCSHESQNAASSSIWHGLVYFVPLEADIGVCSASAITFVRLLIISDLITGFQQYRVNKSETKAQCVRQNLWGCFARTYQILPANITGFSSHRLTQQRCNCCLFLWGSGVSVNQLKCTVNREKFGAIATVWLRRHIM